MGSARSIVLLMGEQPVWTDEYTLLCERCGYVLEGIGPAGGCPECGNPVSESLPSRRDGSAFQNFPGGRNWLVSLLRIARRPRSGFAIVRVDPAADDAMARRTSIAASVLVGLSVGVILALNAWDNPGILKRMFAGLPLPLLVVFGGVGAGVLGLGVYPLLTWIERRGIRYFGARHRWRVTDAVSRTITAHAGVGWLISAIGPALGYVSVGLIGSLWPRTGLVMPSWVRVVVVMPTVGAVVATIPGLLVFESLVAIGVRRCKYANRAVPRSRGDETRGPRA